GSFGRLGSWGRELNVLHDEEAWKLLPRGPARIESERNSGIPLDFVDSIRAGPRGRSFQASSSCKTFSSLPQLPRRPKLPIHP
ncbi:MAG: hypothetical protein ACKOAH_01735, partial [Pirellula sp.]